jgi:hypothetical protein
MKHLFVILCLFVATAGYSQTAPKNEAPKNDVERFQIVVVPATGNTPGGDTYLLDTSTGSVWRAIYLRNLEVAENGTASNPRVWVPMTRLNSDKELADFIAVHSKPQPRQ